MPNVFLKHARPVALAAARRMLKRLHAVRRDGISRAQRRRHLAANSNPRYVADEYGGNYYAHPAYRALLREPALSRTKIERAIAGLDRENLDAIKTLLFQWMDAHATHGYLDWFAARELIVRGLLQPNGVYFLDYTFLLAEHIAPGSSRADFEDAAVLCAECFRLLATLATTTLGLPLDEPRRREHDLTWIMHDWAWCLFNLGQTSARAQLYARYKRVFRRLFPDYPAAWAEQIIQFNRAMLQGRMMHETFSVKALERSIAAFDKVATHPQTSPGYVMKAAGTRDCLKRMLKRVKSAANHGGERRADLH
ncbi:MAG: hypothetical protein NTV22_07020 [bacterium]|nr:hypothetical protein [bacterium]